MSELLNLTAVYQLRAGMFPLLPPDLQKMFPRFSDPVLGDGPNIVSGHLSEMGTGAAFPMVTVSSSGSLEPLTRGTYRHLSMYVDYWSSAKQAQDPDARRIVQIMYNYGSKALQDVNFSTNVGKVALAIKRCYEIDCSDVLFEQTSKLYHVAEVFRVEASADSWY